MVNTNKVWFCYRCSVHFCCVIRYERLIFVRCCVEFLWSVWTSDFQNYLRTQTGNNTTVNIIISTVDYLLRVQVRRFSIRTTWRSRSDDTHLTHVWTVCFQESISDFYWYYSGKDVMDEAGQRNFSRALAVAKQIFNSLTEYIQVTQTHNSTNYRCHGFRCVPNITTHATVKNHSLLTDTLFATCLSLSGSVYWESAEFGSQQTLGCSCWISSCFC